VAFASASLQFIPDSLIGESAPTFRLSALRVHPVKQSISDSGVQYSLQKNEPFPYSQVPRILHHCLFALCSFLVKSCILLDLLPLDSLVSCLLCPFCFQ